MDYKSLLSSLTCRGVFAFGIMAFGQILAGSYIGFNVTLVAIKEKFNYTQTEVELVLSALPVGFGLGMPAGVVLDRCGPRLTSVIGLCVVTPSLSLMYLATLAPAFFHDKSWLLAIIVFFVGNGAFWTFILTWTTGVRRAHPRVRGLVFGIFKSLVLGSPAIFTLVYDRFFMNGHIQDAVNQDVGGYILSFLICFITVNTLAIIVIRDDDKITPEDSETEDNVIEMVMPSTSETRGGSNHYGTTKCIESSRGSTSKGMISVQQGFGKEHRQDGTSKQSLSYDEGFFSGGVELHSGEPRMLNLNKNQQHELSDLEPEFKHNIGVTTEKENEPLVANETSTTDKHISLVELMKVPSWYCLIGALALGLTSDSVIYTNIEVITMGVDLQSYNTALMVFSRVSICIVAFSSGVFLNFVSSHSIRYTILTVGSMSVLVANALFVVTTKHLWILFVGLSLSALGTGMLWAIGAGLMFSMFGAKDYGRNWGIVNMMTFVLTLVMSLIAGRLYDAKVSMPESTTCRGEHCTRDWFILLGSICLVSVLLSFARVLLLLLRKYRKED